jgi:hypothetical protein
MNGISFVKRAQQGSSGGAVPVADDQPLPVTYGTASHSTTTATITSGQSLSAAVNLGGRIACRIELPDTFDPTTVTFEVSTDGTNYKIAKDVEGLEIAATDSSLARNSIPLAYDYWQSVKYMKVRGGTAASPSTVAADRVITIVLL